MLAIQVGNDQFYEVLDKVSGQKGKDDWAKLQELMRPLAKAATAVPPIAIRADPGVALTAVARYLPKLFSGGTDALKLIGPFSKVSGHDILFQCATHRTLRPTQVGCTAKIDVNVNHIRNSAVEVLSWVVVAAVLS